MLKHMLNTTNNSGATGRNTGTTEVRLDQQQPQQNHRYRTPNANSSRISSQFPLNASQLHHLDQSKTCIYTSPLSQTNNKIVNGGLNISRARSQGSVNRFVIRSKHVGVKEMLVSLGLLCLVSLLLALLSLIFLLKISPVTANDIRELLRAEQLTVITAEEYVVVYEVTLALCALTLSLNLCCLLVCAIQFLFAVKLVKSRHGGNDRTNKYLQKSSVSRVCAVGGFFISIPVFLTGIILYTFIQFHSTPAIVTSVFIGLGIIFCGCAMVHNVFIWQREKTNAVKELALQQQQQQQIQQQQQHHQQQQQHEHQTPATTTLHHNSIHSITTPQLNHSHISSFNHSFAPSHATNPYICRPSTTTPPTADNLTKLSHPREASGSVSPGMPTTALELSSVATTNSPHELSTLV